MSDVSFTGRRSFLAVHWPPFSINIYPRKFPYKRSQIINYRNFTQTILEEKSSTGQYPNDPNRQPQRVQFFFVEFQLRPLSERGLLLYLGTLNTDNNHREKLSFISLTLQGGVVEFRVSSPQNHVTVVRSVRMLAIGEWHKIKISQRGRWLTLWVEGSAASALAPNSDILIDPTSLLYIGGLHDLSQLPHYAISGFPVPFRGCVRGLTISGTRIMLNETNILRKCFFFFCFPLFYI